MLFQAGLRHGVYQGKLHREYALQTSEAVGCAMTLHRRLKTNTRQKRALGVQAILEWAFRVEKARLELPPPKNAEEESSGFGMEYVLIQRAQLGCQIDGGRHKMGSYTHVDAEVVAATLAALPDALGGLQMAIRVAELTRAGMTPDWMPNAVPRCVPVEVRRNQHVERAVTEVVGVEGCNIAGVGERSRFWLAL